MKMFLTFCLFVITSFNALATHQSPDSLVYEEKQLSLNVSWAYPSPLETYFHYHNQKSIFEMLSTGNYRGHNAYLDH